MTPVPTLYSTNSTQKTDHLIIAVLMLSAGPVQGEGLRALRWPLFWGSRWEAQGGKPLPARPQTRKRQLPPVSAPAGRKGPQASQTLAGQAWAPALPLSSSLGQAQAAELGPHLRRDLGYTMTLEEESAVSMLECQGRTSIPTPRATLASPGTPSAFTEVK